jgi:hypothetical protein
MASDERFAEALDQLVADAQGSFDYTLTLLRVAGIERQRDELLELADTAPDELLRRPGAIDEVKRLLGFESPLHVIANLLNCAGKLGYNPFPFQHLIRGDQYPYQHPSQYEKAIDLLSRADLHARSSLTEELRTCYVDHGLLQATPQIDADDPGRLRQVLDRCSAFWAALTSRVHAERRKYGTTNHLVKWPRFEVLEILCDDGGLFGFRVYFSNGSHAEYARYLDHTFSLNLAIEKTVGFMVGDLDAMRPEWRIGEKRLYEVGLPGRYNVLGEWKPMVYPGSTEGFMKEITATSSDWDVQGVLFYMHCTGHRVIEFVVCASLDLPIEGVVDFGSTIHPVHLWKCPPAESRFANTTVYDGWAELQTGQPDEIGAALWRVSIALNRLAFAFSADLTWRLKYSNRPIGLAAASPTKEDLPYLDTFLSDIPYVLDHAFDWYNRGRNARNVFTGFLCYFVAIEIVVEAVYSGDVDLQIPNRSKPTRREERVRCIQAKHLTLYQDDPARFVREAYFECVQSLRSRRREVCEAVFGKGHSSVNALFEGRVPTGDSLEDIRNYVAHGHIAHVDQSEIEQVRERLPEIASIAREFLTRILLKLTPDQVVPSWSGTHRTSMPFSDPRATFVTTTLDVFPTKEWKIQPEWCG